MLGSCAELVALHGRAAVVAALRADLDALRTGLDERGEALAQAEPGRIRARVGAALAAAQTPSLKPVFNLTGTLLHTNLGRAPLATEALEAMARSGGAVNLEFELERGRRGERDRHLQGLLLELTGAEAATVVNNNAAAVLIVLNTLASRRDVLVSRGELIEIGGEFRMPEIMKRSGCRLVEVGTTNRTHLRDYAEAIGPRTAAIMKVHASNYSIVGFTRSVSETELAVLAHERELPLISDLGAGALLDLRRWGLPHEPTVREMIECGVDLVTFSADKLLGGPQAGLIAGRAALVARVNRNPLKRVLRVDKLRIAALEATLRLYRDPDRLSERVPILRQLSRPLAEIERQCRRLLPEVQAALEHHASVDVEPCESEAGSGSLPAERAASFAIVIRPSNKGARTGAAVEALARSFRALAVPIVGRIHDGALWLDLRALEDEPGFLAQVKQLRDPR